MDLKKAEKGAKIVADSWLDAAAGDRMLIVTDISHKAEADILAGCALKKGCRTDILITETEGRLVGVYFDRHPMAFDSYDIIICATDYSLVTTLAAKNAIEKGKRLLSLPLHTRDGRSMLEYDFLHCNTEHSKQLFQRLSPPLKKAETVRVTTPKGTDLSFYKKGRDPRFFGGKVKDCGGYSSASIELYIPVEETKTCGVMVADGSYGYAGKINTPFSLHLENGRVTAIENSHSGNILKDFFESYCDERMYTAAELGIGLNPLACCCGNCYIEDESCLGTFHIGFGRNLAFGGVWQASGHFDVTAHSPDIYADGVKIMENGKIII